MLIEPIEAEIVAAYLELSDGPADWVRLAKIRPLVTTGPAEQVTDTLLRMATDSEFVHLVPSSNRKALTAEDHASAVRIGIEDKHLIAIEPEYFVR